jgi:hypothetical protein
MARFLYLPPICRFTGSKFSLPFFSFFSPSLFVPFSFGLAGRGRQDDTGMHIAHYDYSQISDPYAA